MNNPLNKFNKGDIVSGKVIEIEPSKALIKIEGCEPVCIIKEVASLQEIKSIEEVLQLNKIYDFYIAIDYSARYYRTDEYYLSIAELEYWKRKKRLKQLAEEDVIVYSKVIQYYEYGVLVNIENEDFLISNIHLETQIPNQELVGQIIPVKILFLRKNSYNRFYASHRLALNSNLKNVNNSNSTTTEIDSENAELRKKTKYILDDVIVGKVIKILQDYALIDINIEKYAYIALREVSLWAKSCEDFLCFGLTREFIVSDIYYNSGGATLGLSIKQLEKKIGDRRISQIQEEDKNIIIYSHLAKRNHINNGFIVNIEGSPIYLPDSHVNSNFCDRKYLKPNTPLQFFDTDTKFIKVSNRLALLTLRLKQTKLGNLIRGKVRVIKEYGLFIDTKELTVLLHISEVSHTKVTSKDLEKIFKVDDEIKAIVVWMDKEKGRVAVSTKELEVSSGDMLKNPNMVYANAEVMAKRYRKLVTEKLNIADL